MILELSLVLRFVACASFPCGIPVNLQNIDGHIRSIIQVLNLMKYVWCFVIGGSICLIGQILIDKTKLRENKGLN